MANQKQDIIFNIKTGTSLPIGFYKDYFSMGPSISLTGTYLLSDYFMFEADLTYEQWNQKGSAGSFLMSNSFTIGPLLYYPLYKHFHPYIGISYLGS